jgi:peptide deformylase
MLLPILKYGAPELRVVTKDVESFDEKLEEIIKNMVETMYAAPGIGLAACQVGLNLRLATIDLSIGDGSDKLIVLCNPEIIAVEGMQKNDEGCLSVPDFSETVSRPQKMVVRGRNAKGEEILIEGEGLLARCLSHEIDHLNGVLFVDRLSSLKRTLIRNKIKKLAKAGEW